LLALGGLLEKKKGQIKSQSKWGPMNKYIGRCLLLTIF